MRSFLLAAVLALGLGSAASALDPGGCGSGCAVARSHAAAAAPVCPHGKPCGHVCIRKDKVCHKPIAPRNARSGSQGGGDQPGEGQNQH